MNLKPINPPMRPGQTVQCCKCFKLVGEALADMDGKAFEAFWCNECIAAWGKP